MTINAIKIPGRIKMTTAQMTELANQQRGLEPLPLESGLLIKRVRDGGFSGQFLADAFLSMYRLKPFPHSLGDLTKLDAEGFRLFHSILHARFVKGWSDDKLYDIERQIKEIQRGIL